MYCTLYRTHSHESVTEVSEPPHVPPILRARHATSAFAICARAWHPLLVSAVSAQLYVRAKASLKLPVLPTNPAGPLPSAEAARTGVDGWDDLPPTCMCIMPF
jgi:hypothetical protein